MPTVACAWGYCGATEPQSWNADYLLDTPHALLEIVRDVVQASGRDELAA